MRYLKSFNEGKEKEIVYHQDWMMPKSPIRTKLEIDLNDILLEIKDQSGFRCHISGWIGENPVIWIKFRRDKYRSDIDDMIHHIESYLDSEGYRTWEESLRTREGKIHQLYINFDKK